ncbi:hypothetical protein J6590_019672 [Homalodisca vitripennis]|nr:hypothetical protein J6590_019672 [Homalodisca vitripennis]
MGVAIDPEMNIVNQNNTPRLSTQSSNARVVTTGQVARGGGETQVGLPRVTGLSKRTSPVTHNQKPRKSHHMVGPTSSWSMCGH